MTLEFVGKVVVKNEPKEYKNPWGTYVKFYVEFSDGQKAMFQVVHNGKFEIGDVVCIIGITKGEWISVTEKGKIKVINTGEPRLGYRKVPTPYEITGSGHYRKKSIWKGKAPYVPTKSDGIICGTCKECGGDIIRDSKKNENVCENCGLVV